MKIKMDYTKDSINTSEKPLKPRRILRPLEGLISKMLIGKNGGKIIKHNCENLKPPYLLLSTHGSLIDFAMAFRAISPYDSNWLISIEEFFGKNMLLRKAGGIYKRKFTNDFIVVKHILTVLTKNRNIMTIYPEARFSLAGITEQVDGALGKLAKLAAVPVVVFNLKGNFLSSPQWNKKPIRRVPVSGDFTQIVTQADTLTLSAEEIQKKIENALVYDEYKWQYDNKIKIESEYRAHNIHRILYQCPHCKKEFSMKSEKTKIWCEACGKSWIMDEYGRFSAEEGETEFPHVPDWYRWERENVNKEVNSGNYKFEDTARIEMLYSVNTKDGYKVMGNVDFSHDYNGFTVKGVLDDGSEFYLNRDSLSMMSCHIEYDFHERGDALELCTNKATYFVFPLYKKNVLTKIHFAAEALHKRELEIKRNEK